MSIKPTTTTPISYTKHMAFATTGRQHESTPPAPKTIQSFSLLCRLVMHRYITEIVMQLIQTYINRRAYGYLLPDGRLAVAQSSCTWTTLGHASTIRHTPWPYMPPLPPASRSLVPSSPGGRIVTAANPTFRRPCMSCTAASRKPGDAAAAHQRGRHWHLTSGDKS